MKKLFIYYSLTGSGEAVSKKFEEHNYVLRKVVEKKKMSNSSFLCILTGGFRAGMGIKGKLVNYDNDVSQFDEVVIGSPIWNGRFTPAINTVLADTDFSGKKLTFVFYSGSGEGAKALKRVNKEFKDSKVIFLKEPKKYPKELDKLSELFYN